MWTLSTWAPNSLESATKPWLLPIGRCRLSMTTWSGRIPASDQAITRYDQGLETRIVHATHPHPVLVPIVVSILAMHRRASGLVAIEWTTRGLEPPGTA